MIKCGTESRVFSSSFFVSLVKWMQVCLNGIFLRFDVHRKNGDGGLLASYLRIVIVNEKFLFYKSTINSIINEGKSGIIIYLRTLNIRKKE